MNVTGLLTLQGWTFHGYGVWTLPGKLVPSGDEGAKPALRAQERFDGSLPADRKWDIYEQQADTSGPWCWGDRLRMIGNAELLNLAAQPLPASEPQWRRDMAEALPGAGARARARAASEGRP